jgi:hypothetical protein
LASKAKRADKRGWQAKAKHAAHLDRAPLPLMAMVPVPAAHTADSALDSSSEVSSPSPASTSRFFRILASRSCSYELIALLRAEGALMHHCKHQADKISVMKDVVKNTVKIQKNVLSIDRKSTSIIAN